MKPKFILYFLCFIAVLIFSNGRQTPSSLAGQQPEEGIGKETSLTQQQHIAGEIIRLHVIANSDSKEDQALKLQVKDEVVSYLREKLKDAQDVAQARQIIYDNLADIETVAGKKMTDEGYSYEAKASLSYCDFPVKQYGDLTFPAGKYEALRVQLGTSEGKNWWCVMYPSLCYVDETYQVITEENKEQFKKILTKEEYQSLLTAKEPPVFYKSKLKELYDKVIDYFSVKG